MHVSVDGSLANPFVKFGVVLCALVICGSSAAALVELMQKRFIVGGTLALLSVAAVVGTPWLQLRFAWAVQSIVMRRMVATTFFYPPSWWLAPSFGVPLGIILGLIICGRRRAAITAA